MDFPWFVRGANINFSLCDAYYDEILFPANNMSYKIIFEAFFVVGVTGDPHGAVGNYYDFLFFFLFK